MTNQPTNDAIRKPLVDLDVLHDVVAMCERASKQEARTGLQSISRWYAAKLLLDVLPAADRRSIFEAVDYEPPTIDPTQPVPGSRVMGKTTKGRNGKKWAVRKRPQEFRGTPVHGLRFEVVEGYASHSTRRHSARLLVEWGTLLGEFDDLEEARRAMQRFAEAEGRADD